MEMPTAALVVMTTAALTGNAYRSPAWIVKTTAALAVMTTASLTRND